MFQTPHAPVISNGPSIRKFSRDLRPHEQLVTISYLLRF